jgi:hypothetical protein
VASTSQVLPPSGETEPLLSVDGDGAGTSAGAGAGASACVGVGVGAAGASSPPSELCAQSEPPCSPKVRPFLPLSIKTQTCLIISVI